MRIYRWSRITALAMVGDRERVLGAGFDGYIAKPITPETFVAEVESFLKPQQRVQNGAVALAAAALQRRLGTAAIDGRARWPCAQRILVVDNVAANLELARSIFEPSGYRVCWLADVDTAMALARQTRPDLVLVGHKHAGGFRFGAGAAHQVRSEARNRFRWF